MTYEPSNKNNDECAEPQTSASQPLNDLLCVADGDDLPYGVTDSCDECEYCITANAGGTIGGQLFGSRGTFKYCEKGYWKEDT